MNILLVRYGWWSFIKLCWSMVKFTYSGSLWSPINFFQSVNLGLFQSLLSRPFMLHDMNGYFSLGSRFWRIHTCFFTNNLSGFDLKWCYCCCGFIRYRKTHHQKIWRRVTKQFKNKSSIKTKLSSKILYLQQIRKMNLWNRVQKLISGTYLA